MNRPPVIPDHTCPKIDAVKTALVASFDIAGSADTEADQEHLRSLLADIRRELRGEDDRLEEIREANSALRAAAEYWEKEAERLSEELAALQDRFDCIELPV